MLGSNQPRLKFGNRLQAFSNGDHAAIGAYADRRIFDWNLEAAWKALRYLAEGGNAAFPSVRHHPIDLVASHTRDGIDPGSPDPVMEALTGNRIGEFDVGDDCVDVQKECYVRLGDGRGCLSRRNVTTPLDIVTSTTQ